MAPDLSSPGTASRGAVDRTRQPAARRRPDRSRLAPDDADAGGSALGSYLHSIGAYSPLSRHDEGALARRIAHGDHEAVELLVRANLRFVVVIAKRYQHHGVPLLDLISEGNLGLLRAAHRFRPEVGVKFVSYAVWWVRQAIHLALSEQSQLVRVPPHLTGAFHRLTRRMASLEQDLGRHPTVAEIAADVALPEAAVARALGAVRSYVSLDAPLVDDAATPLVDSLPDDAVESPDAALMHGALSALIDASLAALRPREQRILRLYFGLEGEPRTLEQIGVLLGVTRERVRQIRDRALVRLRASRDAALLAHYRHYR